MSERRDPLRRRLPESRRRLTSNARAGHTPTVIAEPTGTWAPRRTAARLIAYLRDDAFRASMTSGDDNGVLRRSVVGMGIGRFPRRKRLRRIGLLNSCCSEPFVCVGNQYSWWDITLSGRIRGRDFNSHIATCWTPQVALIGRLGLAPTLEAHLLPRRREDINGGDQRTFPAGLLSSGDLVVCQMHGRRLEQGVPIEAETPSETGYGGVGVTSVALTVTRLRLQRLLGGGPPTSCVRGHCR
jgi:hypothetical protein